MSATEEKIGEKQQLQWYCELLRRALEHTDDIREATEAAELALSLQPWPEGEFGMVGDEWHGPTAPAEGWVLVRQGERGGKVWKKQGGQRQPAPVQQKPQQQQQQKQVPPKQQHQVQPQTKREQTPEGKINSLRHDLPDDAKLSKAPFKSFGVSSQHSLDIGKVTVDGRDYFYKDSMNNESMRNEAAASAIGMMERVAVPKARTANVPSTGSERGILTNWVDGTSIYDLKESAYRQGKDFNITDVVPDKEIDRHILFSYLYDLGDRHSGNYMVVGNHIVDIDNESFMTASQGIPHHTIAAIVTNDLFYEKTSAKDYLEAKLDQGEALRMSQGFNDKAMQLKKYGYSDKEVNWYTRRAKVLGMFATQGDGTYRSLEAIHEAEFKQEEEDYKNRFNARYQGKYK